MSPNAGGGRLRGLSQWVQLCKSSPNKIWKSNSIFNLLVGFGRACALVRCAHPSFSAHCHTKQGAAPPPPPIAASLLIIRPPEISKIYRILAAHIQSFFFPRDHRGYEIWGPLPLPHPSKRRWFFRKYFGVKMYRCDNTPYSIFPFLYSFCIFSFSSVLFNFFLFISSYPPLLTSSYSYKVQCFVFLFFSSYILNCLLYSDIDMSVILRSFRGGQAFFDPFGVKINVLLPYVLTFLVYPL